MLGAFALIIVQSLCHVFEIETGSKYQRWNEPNTVQQQRQKKSKVEIHDKFIAGLFNCRIDAMNCFAPAPLCAMWLRENFHRAQNIVCTFNWLYVCASLLAPLLIKWYRNNNQTTQRAEKKVAKNNNSTTPLLLKKLIETKMGYEIQCVIVGRRLVCVCVHVFFPHSLLFKVMKSKLFLLLYGKIDRIPNDNSLANGSPKQNCVHTTHYRNN